MRQHVIYFDIDGTLMDNKKHYVPESTKDAVDMLAKEDYKICLATGRMFSTIEEEVLNLYSWDGYVCNNGQTILDKNRQIVFEKNFEKKLIEDMISLADETDTTVELKTFEEHFLVTEQNEAVKKAYRFFGQKIPEMRKYDLYDDIIAVSIFRDKEKSYDDFCDIEGIEVHPGVDCYADITVKGYNKAKGIKKSLELLNMEKYIAIGDSMNDYDMLKAASISIAMGNGEDKLKEIVNHVTKNVDDDGILYAAKWIIDQKID